MRDEAIDANDGRDERAHGKHTHQNHGQALREYFNRHQLLHRLHHVHRLIRIDRRQCATHLGKQGRCVS